MWKNSRRDSTIFIPDSPIKPWKCNDLETVFEASEPTPLYSQEKCIHSFKRISQIESKKTNLEEEFQLISNKNSEDIQGHSGFIHAEKHHELQVYNSSLPIISQEDEDEDKENINENIQEEIIKASKEVIPNTSDIPKDFRKPLFRRQINSDIDCDVKSQSYEADIKHKIRTSDCDSTNSWTVPISYMKNTESALAKLNALKEKSKQNIEITKNSKKQHTSTTSTISRPEKILHPVNIEKKSKKEVEVKIRKSKSYDDIKMPMQKDQQFKARKMPNFSQKWEPLKAVKKITRPKPFNLHTEKRAKTVVEKSQPDEPKYIQLAKVSSKQPTVIKEFKCIHCI